MYLCLNKILGEKCDGCKMAVTELRGENTNIYKKERQMSARFK